MKWLRWIRSFRFNLILNANDSWPDLFIGMTNPGVKLAFYHRWSKHSTSYRLRSNLLITHLTGAIVNQAEFTYLTEKERHFTTFQMLVMTTIIEKIVWFSSIQFAFSVHSRSLSGVHFDHFFWLGTLWLFKILANDPKSVCFLLC